METENSNHVQLTVLESVILALNRRVAFQRLQDLSLSQYRLKDAGWDTPLSALARAPRLTSLELNQSNLSLTNMSTFSALLSQDAFAMLQSLNLSDNRSFGDKGVAHLVQGLLAPACRARLTLLVLDSVGMGDKPSRQKPPPSPSTQNAWNDWKRSTSEEIRK
jgi:hypothetical protein